MDCSLESMYKKLVATIPIGKPKTDYTKLHLAILQHYITYLQKMSEEEIPGTLICDSEHLTKISEAYAQELKKYVFRVPRLKQLLPQSQNVISQYRAVKEFISLLVRLLYHKPGSITDSCVDQINNLEKELRFLLTVVGDSSLMVCAYEHQEFENVLAEFEAVANEAGFFVHSLFFLRASREIDDGIAVVQAHINLLKANIIKLSTVAPDNCMCSRSTLMPHNTSVVESLLVLDSLVRDLEDQMSADDNSTAEVKDQIQTLHQGLISLQSFTKDTGSPQDQLKEYYMQIGDLAHEAQYLFVSFLAGDAPPWYLVNRLIHVNHKIKLCRIELPDFTMKYESGGLKVAKYSNKQLPSSLTKSNTKVDDDIVGFEEKKTYILDQLVGGGAGLQVISIFGMPGLGKTALAKKLYNHPSVNCRFDRLSWCVVSQIYLKRNVLANILIDIASDLCKDMILEMEEASLVERIHKTLKGRRYLIVMDDIWDSNACDELLACFPDDGNGSRVMFTTRNKDVAPLNCILYALAPLSDGQCWEILRKKVFENQPCPPELVESGRELAASCQGLPLAAVVIAGILSATDKGEKAWEEVRTNLCSHILDGEENSVILILRLSYDHLPQHLKLCFLYLGVLFVDQEIPVRHLMNLWIAEGFIPEEKEKDAAEECLKELTDRSLVMVGRKRSDGGPETCNIHDLLRELCLKTCKEENLMRFVNNKYLENEEDRLKVELNSTTWMCCQYMRNRFGPRRTRHYQIEVPDMRQLRVLYFDCSFNYMTGIEYLVCLKYLVVRDLPPSVGNLVNLEYLRVVSNRSVHLSSAIMKMRKLKYVDVAYGARYGKDCNTSLTNKLEFLSHVLIRNVKDKKMLKCSPHLRRLKCYYTEWLYGFIDMSFLTRLESLTLGFSSWVTIAFPSSIKKLTLIGYGGNMLCRKTMSMIGRLENLEVLKLIGTFFERFRWDTQDGEFQNLRYLRLHLINFRHRKVGSSQHFPKLQQLELSVCSIGGGFLSEIGKLPTMQIIGVDNLLKKSARKIQEEQRDMGNEDLKVIIRTYFYFLPSNRIRIARHRYL